MELSAVIIKNESLISREWFNSMLQHVSAARRERIGQFRSYRDAQNCLLADILARSEICRISGLDNERLVFTVNKYGKPALQNLPGLHYNISHSGHYIAFAADDRPVGIDIESYRKKNDIEKIARRFFAPDETGYIMDAAGEERTRRFYEIWTMKESMIKRDGRGLAVPLPSFSVIKTADTATDLYYHNVYESGEAVCHVCACKKQPPEVRVMEAADLEIN